MSQSRRYVVIVHDPQVDQYDDTTDDLVAYEVVEAGGDDEACNVSEYAYLGYQLTAYRVADDTPLGDDHDFPPEPYREL